jgi:hypothetical protein
MTMTTRTPPTAEDIRGETQRGRDAYNERRRWMRSQGLRVPPDLYDDDLVYVTDDRPARYSEAQYWEDVGAERRAGEVYERETQSGWSSSPRSIGRSIDH